MESKIAIHWFRRDLRLEDNVGLHQSLKSGYKVQCVFIFDKDIMYNDMFYKMFYK